MKEDAAPLLPFMLFDACSIGVDQVYYLQEFTIYGGTLMETFGQILTKARKAHGLTQEQLAEKLNVSRQTVSHWENGRMQPEEAVIQQLCELLDITPESTQQPTEHTTPKKPYGTFLLGFICGMLVISLVIYGLLPLLTSPAVPATNALQDKVQDLQDDSIASYPFEWYQQPAVNEEEKAYLTFRTGNTPVELTESFLSRAPYGWNVQYIVRETNGVSFTATKVSQVYFNEQHEVVSGQMTLGEECERYWKDSTIQSNTEYNFGTRVAASPVVGYGVAIQGVDANGNELEFGFYLPLSQNVKAITAETFQREMVPEENKAFLEIKAGNDPVPLVYDTEYDGDYGWMSYFSIENKTDIDFTASKLTISFLNGDELVDIHEQNPDELTLLRGSNVFKKADDLHYQIFGAAKRALTGVGIMLEGVDANGNEQSFVCYTSLSDEVLELSPAMFEQETEAEEGKAFIHIWPTQNPVKLVKDAQYEGNYGWKFEFFAENTSDIEFTATHMTTAFFNEEAAVLVFEEGTEEIVSLKGNDVFRKGDEPFGQEMGSYKDELTAIGLMIKGVDANGNELSFASLATLSQESMDP